MRIINAAVILLALRENEGIPFDLPRSRAWHERFFFDPRDGVRAYFERVSSGDVLVHGHVFDWLRIDNLNWRMGDITDRQKATELAIKLHEQQGSAFNEYNLVALVVSAPPSPAFEVNDGSSGAYSATGTYHHAILARDGGGFDFMVHEVGHGLGLDHSCGNNPVFKTQWGNPTEYGHPFCVMSAASYGGRGANWVAPTPGEGRPEYVGRCPAVNAATARALGWIDAHSYDPAGDGTRTFTLTSVDLARRGVGVPGAVQVTTPQGVFVIEYRGPAAWDLGQREPMVIVNQGAGGRADVMHPGTQSGTYLGHIARGFDPGQPGSLVNIGSCAVELVDLAADLSNATVRLTPGRLELMPLALNQQLQLRSAVTIGEGSTTFAPGDRLCVSGTWGYRQMGNQQEATFDATWARARAQTMFAWEVAGEVIPDAGGELRWWGTVRSATPLGGSLPTTKEIRLTYAVTAIAGGSRLTLRNHPDDETYDVQVKVRMADPVAAAEADDTVTFTGIEFVYPPEFYAAEQHCLDELRDPNRAPSHMIVFPWDLWKRLGPREAERVRSRIVVLEQLAAGGHIEQVSAAVAFLARELGIGTDEIRVRPVHEATRLSEVRLHIEPHSGAID